MRVNTVLTVLYYTVNGISPPRHASELTKEEALDCLKDDECWMPYLKARQELRERQENLLWNLKKQFQNRNQGPGFQQRNPSGRFPSFGNDIFGSRPSGPSGPFRRPPSPTDFMTPDDGMPPIPSAENRPPIYKGPLAIDVKIGQEVQEQLHVHDPDGDPISYSITETKGGFISEDGLFTYSFKDSDLTLYNSLEAIEELHKITFFYSDGINPEQQHLVNFNVCSCHGASLCNYDDAKSQIDRIFISTCICVDTAWTGRFCDEDKNGCEDDEQENECFPGTECIDMKAPASGYICGACPDGYKGDGRNCELVDDLELRCLEIPELQNGYIQDVNDTIIGVYENQAITYACDTGYELLGNPSITCQEDGEFDDNPPICRDANECLRNLCHPTAQCRNTEGSYECYCDNDSQKNYDGNVPENEKECNPVVGFDKQVSVCSATSNTISLTWDIGSRWRNDPAVIDKFIVYWVPMENENTIPTKLIDIQDGIQKFDDYEDVLNDEASKNPDFLYAVHDYKTSSVNLQDLEPNTYYHVTVSIELIKGTVHNKRINCRVRTLPGIPTPPRAPSSKDITGTSVTLSFLPPEKPRGEIENYVVEHTIADPLICENGDKLIEIKTLCLPRYTIISAIDESQPNSIIPTLDAQVTGLEPHRKYKFRVAALTKSTEGEWTEPVTTKTSAPLPNEPSSQLQKRVEACIDVKLALVDEYDEPVPWSNEFRDLGSPSSRSWMEKVSQTLPDLHFISNTNLAFVEIAQVKYSEFNDQVIMESRLSIIQYSNRKISAEQIQSVVTRIFNEIMSKFADVNGENTVQKCDTCENNDCDPNARCVSMPENYTCMCKPGYIDESPEPFQGLKCTADQKLLAKREEKRQDRVEFLQSLESKICQQTKADIYFLLDLSKTVTKSDLEIVIQMMRQILRVFTYDDKNVRFALGTFAQTFGEVFNFATYQSRQEILSDTLELNFVDRGKGTRMGKAVNEMIQYINRPRSGRRKDVPLHVVAITDGNSFDDVTEPGSRLQRMAQSIQVIAVGKSVDPTRLLGMVHTPNDIISIESYEDLSIKDSDKDYVIGENIYHGQVLDNICPSDACPGFAAQDIVLLIENSSKMADVISHVKNAVRQFVGDLDIKQEDNTAGDDQSKLVRIAMYTYSNNYDEIFSMEENPLRKTQYIRNTIDDRLFSSESAVQNLPAALGKIISMSNGDDFRKLDNFFNWNQPDFIPSDPFSPLNNPKFEPFRNAKVVVLAEGLNERFIEESKDFAQQFQDNNIDLAVIEINEERSDIWTEIVTRPEYAVYVPKNTRNDRLDDDIYNAFREIKHTFFHGGCENAINSPSWVNVIANDETSLSVTWEPLVGVDGYDLNITNIDGLTDGDPSLGRQFRVSPDIHKETIGDLAPGKQWKIDVSSIQYQEGVMEGGEVKSNGAASNSAWTKPVQAVVEVLEVGEYKANVRLDIPYNTGDIQDIRVYLLDKSEDDANNIIESEVLTMEKLRQMNNIIPFNGIHSNTTYEIQVETSSGPVTSNIESAVFKTRSLEPPKNIQIIDATTEGVTIQWDYDPTIASVTISVQSIEQDGAEGEVLFEDEKILQTLIGPDGIERPDPMDTRYTVNEALEPGTDYEIYMVAKNVLAQNSQSSPRVVFTTVSEPIFMMKQDHQSEDKIRISFTPPVEGGADHFELVLFNSDKSEMIDSVKIPFIVGEKQYIETFQPPRVQLTPGTDYVIQGIAVSCPYSCGGNAREFASEPLEIRVVTETDLEAPEDVEVISTTQDSIELKWTAVEKADEYRVLVFEADHLAPGKLGYSENAKKRTSLFQISTGIIKNLTPGTQYTSLVTGVRNGNSGKPIQVTTWTKPQTVESFDIDTGTRDGEHFVDIRFYYDANYQYFNVLLKDISGNLIDEKNIEDPVKIGGENRFLVSFDELKASTKYTIEIEAFIGGFKSVSEIAEFETRKAIPPQELTKVEEETTYIRVTYTPSADADRYQINVRNADGAQIATFATSDLEYQINNLDPGTNYKVTVSSISKGEIGVPSEELNVWTKPALIREPIINFGTLSLQVTFQQAKGGVDHYTVQVKSMDNDAIIDMRQFAATDYLSTVFQSKFFYPSKQYKVLITTVRGPLTNTFTKIGSLQTHRAVITYAAVDEDGDMRARWGLGEDENGFEINHDGAVDFDWKIVDQVTGDVVMEEKGLSKREINKVAFDRTRQYKIEVRAKLKKVWSQWTEKLIDMPNIPTLAPQTPSIQDQININGDSNASDEDDYYFDDNSTDAKSGKIVPQPSRQSGTVRPSTVRPAAGLIPSTGDLVANSGVCDNIPGPVDLVFVLDASSSVKTVNFRKMKDWIRMTVKELKIGEDAVHVGLSLFNNIYRPIFKLRDFDTNFDMLTAIRDMPYKGRGTLIQKALDKTLDEQLAPGLIRPDAEIYVYLLTDGLDKSGDIEGIKRNVAAIEAVSDKIKLVSIGIGDTPKYAELMTIASEPKRNHFFQLSSYDDLDYKMQNLILWHAGCNVAPPFNFTIPEPTLSPDEVIDAEKVSRPIVQSKDMGGKQFMTGVKSKLDTHDVQMTYYKPRGKKVKVQVVLEKVEPGTKTVVDTVIAEPEDTGTMKMTHTFEDLETGYEYYGKARAFIEKQNGDRTYSDFVPYEDLVHFSPPPIKVLDVEKKTDSMKLVIDEPNGHVDSYLVTHSLAKGKNPKSETVKFDMASENLEILDNKIEITLGPDHEIVPAASYIVTVQPISGNKRGDELELPKIELPEMGSPRARQIDLGMEYVIFHITKPDGADGIEIKTTMYGRDEQSVVGNIEELGNNEWKVGNLEINTQFRAAIRAYRTLPSGQLYFSEEQTTTFWTRPGDIDCETIQIESLSNKIDVSWTEPPRMNSPSARYQYILEKMEEMGWNEVTSSWTRSNYVRFYNNNGQTSIKPDQLYRLKIYTLNGSLKSAKTCEKELRTKPLPVLSGFNTGQKDGVIEANWEKVEGVEEFKFKIYELNQPEYEFLQALSDDEFDGFDTSGLTVTEVAIPNGDADSYTLSSKTIVKSGVPYLVQMNPAAADEEGPPVFDIQVIAPSEPSAKAIATADDGIMLYIEPGEGKTEQFEIIVRDVQTKDEIRREIISADERDADGDIRHTITDPELERDQRVDVEVKALSFGKESNAFQINDFAIRPPPEETIQINKIGKTKVDITRPDRAGREFRLTVTNTAGETVVDNVELEERFHSISDLVHNEKYKITIEAFENGRLVQTYNEEIETIALEITNIEIEEITDRSMTLTWEPDPLIKTYKFELAHANGPPMQHTMTTEVEIPGIELPGILLPGTQYTATITPFDSEDRPGNPATKLSNGEGIVFTTKPKKPSIREIFNDEFSDFIRIVFDGVLDADYYEIEVYPAGANTQNRDEQVDGASTTIPNDTSQSEFEALIEKSTLEFDRDYEFLIYSVLNTDTEQLRSLAAKQVFNMPPQTSEESSEGIFTQFTTASPFPVFTSGFVSFDPFDGSFVPFPTSGPMFFPTFGPTDVSILGNPTMMPFTMPQFLTTGQPGMATTQPLDCEMLDVVIMPQSSKSMPWGRVQNFMTEVADRLVLNEKYAGRMAVLTFGRQPRLEIGFDSYNGKQDLLERIAQLEKSDQGGHFIDKALNYVSKEMLSEDGLFRDNAKLLVLVILSSMSKSEPLEIEEAMNLMGRLTNREFSQLSTAEIHVIHADPRSDRDPVEYNKQLQALQTPDRSDTKSFLHNVGLLGEANPDDPMDLQIKRDGLARFDYDFIFNGMNACLMEKITTTSTTTTTMTPTTIPMFPTTFPTIEFGLFSTEPDYPSMVTEANEMLSTLTEIYSTTADIATAPPPPPPLMPPTAPPHIRRIMLEKLKNKEPVKEPDLTTKPVAESQQGITPSPQPTTTTRRKRRMPPPPPPPPMPPSPPPKRKPEPVVVTFTTATTVTGPTTKKPKRRLPPPPPPPPLPPAPPATIMKVTTTTTPTTVTPTIPIDTTTPIDVVGPTTPEPGTLGTTAFPTFDQTTSGFIVEPVTTVAFVTTSPSPELTRIPSMTGPFSTTPFALITTEAAPIPYTTTAIYSVPMIAAIGLVDTGTSLFSNSSQLNNDELEAIKDILTDRQSANYKDLENQIITKLDTVLDTFVPDASDPRLAFIDFDNGFIRPHFSFNLPEDQPLETVERDLEGSELASPDQEGELVDFSKKIQTLQISNGIEREYGMRVIYKDNDSNQLPSRLYTSKITQTITGSDNVDRVSIMMDSATGLPRQSPSKFRQQFLNPFGTKEGLYTITTPAGLDTNPWDLENELGSDEMLRRLDVLVSENEFKAQRIEIFPLGLLELLELQEGVIVVEPDQDPDKYTGFFIASNLDPENVYSLYEKPKGPFTNQFTKNVEENGLDSDNIKKPFMDIYYEPISEDQVKVHFGITADPNVTADDLVDELNGQIDLTDEDNNYIATLDNVELSSARKFEVEVTSDLSPDDIKTALENGMDEIKLIDNFGKDENGKTTFDFTSERNLNIVPANFPELEDKIDEILGSEDARIKVPGGDLVPLKPWIGKYAMIVEPDEFLMVLADWEKSILPIIQSLDIPPGWDIDYKAAISKDESKIELYLSGEASYALSARELMANMAFMAPTFSIADLTLNQPRMFKGTCDAFIQEAGVFETSTLKTRIEDFLNGYNEALYPTQIYFNNSEVYKLEDNILRKRRQAEEELNSINNIEFYFKSNEPRKLTPQELQSAGRKIIADNKSFQSLFVGDSLIITPYMWEEDRIVTTPEPDDDTTTIENTVTTTEPTTTTPQIVVVTDPPVKETAPTVPPKTTTGHVTTFTSDTDPVPTDENINDLEEKLDNCNEITNTQCKKKEKETFIATQCKYDVTIANDMSSRDRDQIIENCIKSEYTTDPNDVIFNQNVTYMTPNPEGTCADVYENDCDTETSDCQYDEETGEIFCQCKEGFIKETEGERKSKCIPEGPDITLIILIILIIILFLVILFLSYLVHQKRTKTGIYSPSKHQPNQTRSP